MNRQEKLWKRLTVAARQAETDEYMDAPYGFAERVVSRRTEHAACSLLSTWERLTNQVLAGACGVLLISLCATFALHHEPEPDVASLPERTIESVLAP